MSQQNDHLVLIGGKSGGGKSASLRNLPEPEGVLYLNCEAGKKLPFAAKFRKGPDGQTGFKITDPYQVYDAFDFAEKQGNSIHTIVVDSQTFLMDMFESVHVIPAADTQKAWGMYQQYYKNLMQQYVAGSSKNVIFTAHIIDVLNDSEHVMETKVPVKGALKNQGIEAYFSTVVEARKMNLIDLEPYQNSLLTITEEERMLGFKYVYQTRITKESVGHRIRSNMGMWSVPETFIDNDAAILLKRLHDYYA